MMRASEGEVHQFIEPLLWSEAMTTDGGVELRLPLGTVTFLLTDIERSTAHWHEAPDEMRSAVIRHYAILDDAVAVHGGVRPEEQGEGDSIVAAFSRASDAVSAALRAQQQLQREQWPTPTPIRVRMAVHTGEAQVRDGSNYVGLAIIRAARLRSIAVGGQVLVSSASRDLAFDQLGDAVELRELGAHRLKDLARPELVYQLVHDDILSDFPPLRSLDSTPNNLPVRLSTFIGREAELVTLAGLLAERRLVTVTGSGGAGKTRLVLQAAADAIDNYPDGVWWIELAPLTEPSSVLQIVAKVVGARLIDSQDPMATISGRLNTDRALLILDNCEHLADITAALADTLLQRCPNIVIAATSRTPLDIPGETTWRVPPLSLPVRGSRMPLDQLSQLDSVRLFADRARDVRSTFRLTDSNAPEVADICHRLDGIPLAIELAAARTRILTPEQILRGLSDALSLLRGGPRRVLPRRQTLDASIAWSAQLLDEDQRKLLARLSVFSGSFDLASAEIVCAADGIDELAVLDALDRLVSSSLISVLDDQRSGRFTMLETVRQYGARQLRAGGDERTWLDRHAHHFERLAHEIAPACETARQEGAIEAIEADYDNIRSALHWLLLREESARLVQAVIALGSFWDVSGVRTDAAYWCDKALSSMAEEPSVARCRLLALSGESRIQIGEFTGGFRDAASGLEMATAIDDPWGAGRASATLTTILGVIDLAAWRTHWAQSEALHRRAGDTYSLTRLLTWKGVMLVRRGITREGLAALHDSWADVLASGQPMLTASHRMWEGHAALNHGNPALADELCQRALSGPALRGASRIVIAQSTRALSRAYRFLERDAAAAHLERLDRARRNNDSLQADIHLHLGAYELLHEDPARCRRIIDDWHSAHTRRMPLALAAEGIIAAHAAYELGDIDDAASRAGKVVAWSAASDSAIDRARATVLLGAIALHRGDTPHGERLGREAIADLWMNGNLMALCDALELIAAVAAACRNSEEAALILGAAGRQRAAMSSPRGILIDLATGARERALTDMGVTAFDAAFAAGHALSIDETVAYLERTHGARGRPSLGWHSLTPTERQVADLVSIGLTNREIGTRLIMGSETVKTHLSHTFTKLAISKRAQLAVLATEHTLDEASGADERG